MQELCIWTNGSGLHRSVIVLINYPTKQVTKLATENCAQTTKEKPLLIVVQPQFDSVHLNRRGSLLRRLVATVRQLFIVHFTDRTQHFIQFEVPLQELLTHSLTVNERPNSHSVARVEMGFAASEIISAGYRLVVAASFGVARL